MVYHPFRLLKRSFESKLIPFYPHSTFRPTFTLNSGEWIFLFIASLFGATPFGCVQLKLLPEFLGPLYLIKNNYHPLTTDIYKNYKTYISINITHVMRKAILPYFFLISSFFLYSYWCRNNLNFLLITLTASNSSNKYYLLWCRLNRSQ